MFVLLILFCFSNSRSQTLKSASQPHPLPLPKQIQKYLKHVPASGDGGSAGTSMLKRILVKMKANFVGKASLMKNTT